VVRGRELLSAVGSGGLRKGVVVCKESSSLRDGVVWLGMVFYGRE
jgi:hypothetical protein